MKYRHVFNYNVEVLKMTTSSTGSDENNITTCPFQCTITRGNSLSHALYFCHWHDVWVKKDISCNMKLSFAPSRRVWDHWDCSAPGKWVHLSWSGTLSPCAMLDFNSHRWVLKVLISLGMSGYQGNQPMNDNNWLIQEVSVVYPLSTRDPFS